MGRRRLLVIAAVVLALLLPVVRGETEDVNRWRIESVVERGRGGDGAEPWHRVLGKVLGKWGVRAGGDCEEHYGIMPCSTSLGGNAMLLVAYGYMLLLAAQMLSDGSELLLTVMSPGVIGGLVLPVLGAFPDALLIAASGLGATQADAQEEVLVGMGLVAGSSVMLLTALWGACLIAGRCDLVEHPTQPGKFVAKDRTLTKGFHLTETGVTSDRQTKWASWIMMGTLLPFFVAQLPRLLNLKTEGHFFIAIAAVVSTLGLIAYCTYQLVAPWIQERRIDWAQTRYRRNYALHRIHHISNEQNWGSIFTQDGRLNEEALKKLYDHFDEDHNKLLTETELRSLLLGLGIERHNGKVPEEDELKHWMKEFDVSGDGQISEQEFLEGVKRWMNISMGSFRKKSASTSVDSSPSWDFEAQAKNTKLDLAALEDEANDEEEEENKEPPSRGQIVGKAVLYLVAGAVVAAVFADPLVDAIGGFSKASGISPFFISFIATPLATNSSEAISSLIFAKRKRKKNISMTYSQIYGAVTMNNTMCLGIFLAIVYFRGLQWDFSAEISVIFFATLIMGFIAAVRTTFPLWMAFIGLALYPISIGLVAFLDYVCGWH